MSYGTIRVNPKVSEHEAVALVLQHKQQFIDQREYGPWNLVIGTDLMNHKARLQQIAGIKHIIVSAVISSGSCKLCKVDE